MRLGFLALVTALSIGTVSLAQAETRNPIFGKAHVRTTTALENKSVLGKGYYADYYGYYGNLYNNYAGQYGNAGYNYKDSSYYDSASRFAGGAANFYSSAAYYQANGL